MKRAFLPLALAAVLAPACGVANTTAHRRPPPVVGKAEYQRSLSAAMTEFRSVLRTLEGHTTLAGFATALASAERRLMVAARDLNAVNPPNEAEQQNQQLVGGLRALAAQLHELRLFLDEARHRRLDTVDAATDLLSRMRFGDSIEQIQDARDELARRGYKATAG